MEYQNYICVKINGIYEYLTQMDILMFLNNKTKTLYSKYSKHKQLELTDKEYKALMKELDFFMKSNKPFNHKDILTPIIEINTDENTHKHTHTKEKA